MNQEILQLSMAQEGESQIDIFQKKEMRKVFHNNEWWFSVVDIIRALIDTNSPSRYWTETREKLQKEGASELFGRIEKLKMLSVDKKMREAEGIKIEDIFRLMQSIPTKKAEPFKKWLARVGYERIQELQDPEIAIKRAVAIYKAKGYPDDWVDARITNKVSRDRLVTEWDKRGLKEPLHFAILTNAIHVETFDIDPPEHRKIKGLKRQNLRDNMTPLELTLMTLGEQTAKAISESRDDHEYQELHSSAKDAGKIAGNARKEIEKKTKNRVVSPINYLTERQRRDVLPMPDNINETMKRLLEIPVSKE